MSSHYVYSYLHHGLSSVFYGLYYCGGSRQHQGTSHTVNTLHFVWKWFCFVGCITVVDNDSIRVHLTLSTRFILCGSGSVLSVYTSHCQHASFCEEVVLLYVTITSHSLIQIHPSQVSKLCKLWIVRMLVCVCVCVGGWACVCPWVCMCLG